MLKTTAKVSQGNVEVIDSLCGITYRSDIRNRRKFSRDKYFVFEQNINK